MIGDPITENSKTVPDFDSPWKEVIERFFKDFMAFFFPFAYAAIDWDKGFEFLDKELQKIVQDANLGRRLADKLVKVWRHDGVEEWVLTHIEAQGDKEEGFSKRMYVYNDRIFDRYDRKVVSFAILTDENASWRPSEYS